MRVVIRHQQMQRRFVFLDVRKTPYGQSENVIGQVVIHRRDFADQDITIFTPERVPVVWEKRY